MNPRNRQRFGGRSACSGRFSRWLAYGLYAAIAFVLLRPTGFVGNYLSGSLRRYQERRSVNRHWTQLANGPRLGNPNALSLLIEFSDYECPFCRQASTVIDSVLRRYPGVALVYHHLPLSIHPAARGAALAGICAAQQGHFRNMHAYLFTTNSWMDDRDWAAAAGGAEVENLAAFADCMGSSEAVRLLAQDLELASSLGIKATPTFVHKRGLIVGVPTGEQLSRLIEDMK